MNHDHHGEFDADAEWHADRLARRIAAIRNQRPARLRAPGDLDPDIAAWGRQLLAGTVGNLVIVGPVGTGKTWSAWEVLERAVVAGYPGKVLFATSAQWQDAVAPPVDRDRLRAMRSADVLVLDDLGSGRINDWQRECLMSVVDERWQHGLPIVITSNMADAEDSLGDRLTSRLSDGAAVVAINGTDRRGGQ
ncbi:ATP-binding protein [Streptosporangium canum]|uniref:ATP-binding protein n=1 Tax=Streptosporangium canum TaxID=324952 RepID=UPI0036D08E51